MVNGGAAGPEPAAAQERSRRRCAPTCEQLARDSITTFSRRYGYTPTEPITIEIYPDHDDFAVRIAGLAGHRPAGRDLRQPGGDGQPVRAQDRRLPLGQHAVARDGACVHAVGDAPPRAALVERRPVGARGMDHRARRRASSITPTVLDAFADEQAAADRAAGRRLHATRPTKTRCRCPTAGRPRLPVCRAALGIREAGGVPAGLQ